MADELVQAMATARNAFALQDAEWVDQRTVHLATVVRQTASGSNDIDAMFGLDRKFRLVFLRAHFSGGEGTSPLKISLDSGAGAAFDVRLFTVLLAGQDKDVNLRIEHAENVGPSPWTFQADDVLRVQWTNPDSGVMSWGVEVGLSVAL